MYRRPVDALDEIRIPHFDFPWHGSCSPLAAEIEEEMREWAVKSGLVPDERYRERIARAKFAWLASRWYPAAGREWLTTIAHFFGWLFLADDFFVDRVDPFAPTTIPNLTAVIDVLDFDRLGPQPVYSEVAWLDVCRRLRKQLSGEQFQRFAYGMRMWASAAAMIILDHVHPQSVGIRQYETIRRYISAVYPPLDLIDAVNGELLAAAEYYRIDVQQLRMRANNIISWSNDIHSLAVEVRQPGQYRNMVVIYVEQGYSPQEAVDLVAARVRSEIGALTHSIDLVQSKASPALHTFIEGLENAICGYQDWVELDTQRYSNTFAGQDADDRSP
jgi:hypothetical protein